ncbi:MAG: radical SAM protein [Deltaproteobacteria bacterium]|nr:radical SAM protein [Deltaproteobacteria bacterium]
MSGAPGLTVVHAAPGGQTELLERDNRYRELLFARFGQRFLDYRAAWAEAGPFHDPGARPLSLDLAVNSGCQLSCLMCPLPARRRRGGAPAGAAANSRSPGPPADKQPPPDVPMSDGLYARLMDEARETSLPAMTLGLASEPLLRPGIVRLIERAVGAGVMDVRLGTNGAALTRALAEGLVGSGLTRLEVSVDAVTAGTYRSVRPGGDFDALVRSIDDFLDLRAKNNLDFPLLRLSFLRLPQNEGELDMFLERFAPLADMVSVQKPVWFPGSRLPRPGSLDDPDKNFRLKAQSGVRCHQPWQRLGLDQSGRAWPCCSWHGESLLNLSAERHSVSDIWRSGAMTELRRGHEEGAVPAACRDCVLSGAY